jgi:uncharacterized membrane protein
VYKMLAVVFDDEKSAYQGAQALADLNAEGSIDVYAVAVLQKDAHGRVATKKADGDFPIKTVAGTTIGGLIGLLGGPAGVAVGSGIGVVAGLIGDMYIANVDEEFLAEVSTALTPGKCAVIAEVDEEWVTPVDTRMEALGGVVYRTLKSTFEHEQWSQVAADARTELDQLKAEEAQARADRKAKLQAQIERLSKRVDAKLDRAKTRSRQASEEFQAKVAALQKRVDKERGDKKTALEARIAARPRDEQPNPFPTQATPIFRRIRRCMTAILSRARRCGQTQNRISPGAAY